MTIKTITKFELVGTKYPKEILTIERDGGHVKMSYKGSDIGFYIEPEMIPEIRTVLQMLSEEIQTNDKKQ